MAKPMYIIEVVNCPPSIYEKIPASAWTKYGTATTPIGALRVYRRARKQYAPRYVRVREIFTGDKIDPYVLEEYIVGRWRQELWDKKNNAR